MAQKSWAQQLPAATEQQLENITELTEEETEDDSYLLQLQFYQSHPLNLNTAMTEALQTLRLLTPLQIENFLRYRKLFHLSIAL